MILWLTTNVLVTFLNGSSNNSIHIEYVDKKVTYTRTHRCCWHWFLELTRSLWYPGIIVRSILLFTSLDITWEPWSRGLFLFWYQFSFQRTCFPWEASGLSLLDLYIHIYRQLEGHSKRSWSPKVWRVPMAKTMHIMLDWNVNIRRITSIREWHLESYEKEHLTFEYLSIFSYLRDVLLYNRH